MTVPSMDSDEEARFTQIYRRHHTAIHDYCKRHVPDEMVDDVVAEVFLTAWRRLDEVPDGDATGLWSFRVAWFETSIAHHLSPGQQHINCVGAVADRQRCRDGDGRPWSVPRSCRLACGDDGPLKDEHDLALRALPEAGDHEAFCKPPAIGGVCVEGGFDLLGVECAGQRPIALGVNLVFEHGCVLSLSSAERAHVMSLWRTNRVPAAAKASP